MLKSDVFIGQQVSFISKTKQKYLCTVLNFDEDPDFVVIQINGTKEIFKKSIKNLLGLL